MHASAQSPGQDFAEAWLVTLLATYPDAHRWRIRFAYFDPQGMAQESVDEMLNPPGKPGGDCLAVFPPERPDLASFRPLGAV